MLQLPNNLEPEQWAPIPQFEGLYEVSSHGNFRSVYKNRKRPVKPWQRPDGYLSISLCKESKLYRRLVHRVVAEVFVPNPESKPQVNHKDTRKNNNVYGNLEWSTGKENIAHAVKHGRMNYRKGKKTNHPLAKRVIDTGTGTVYRNVRDAALSTGVKYRTLLSWLKEEYPNHSPYKFEDHVTAAK